MTSITDKPPTLKLARKRLLFVMAATPEYGPHLQARFKPLLTGVGPIEAGIVMGAALQRLKDGTGLPDLVVAIGSSGSRRRPVGEVFQISHVAWRDIDASRLGFAKGVTPFLDHPVSMPLATPLDWPMATLSTGGAVIGGEDYAAIDADLVDMETFAYLRACQHFDVPLMALRGVSDGPGELSDMPGWTELLHLLDERLAGAVDRLFETIGGAS